MLSGKVPYDTSSNENQREPSGGEYASGVAAIGFPFRPNPESWVVWSSVPITEAGTNVNEGEVPLQMKYRQLLAVAPGVGMVGGMRIK